MLDATAGGTEANSYVDPASDFVTKYFALFVSAVKEAAWGALSEAERSRRLVWATTLIDEHLTFVGVKVAETQRLEWPRIYLAMDTRAIPERVMRGTLDFAIQLAADRTLDNQLETLNLRKIKAGDVNIETAGVRAKVIPDSVWFTLSPYLLGTRSRDGVKSHRVVVA